MPKSVAKDQGISGGNGQPGAGTGSTLDGLTLQNLDAQTRSRYHIAPSVKQGVVVTEVEPTSTAAEQGLRPGDVVLQVDRQKSDSIQRFKELYGKSKGKVLLLVSRRGNTLFLVVSH